MFDPFGFVAPFIFTAKYIMHELCKLNYGWDEIIPDSFIQPWKRWLSGPKVIENFDIARCIKPKDFGDVTQAQFHHFCDASERGYGTVSYLRLVNAQRKVHVSFIMGKSRVAPLK